MINKILIMYCIVDDILKALGHREDSRRQMEDAEVITTAQAQLEPRRSGSGYAAV